jgi:hypothetical protein
VADFYQLLGRGGRAEGADVCPPITNLDAAALHIFIFASGPRVNRGVVTMVSRAVDWELPLLD